MANTLVLSALLGLLIERRLRARFVLNPDVIGDALAAGLLRDYHGDLPHLSRDGVAQWARERYLQMAAGLGLPSEAADVVTGRVLYWLDAARE